MKNNRKLITQTGRSATVCCSWLPLEVNPGGVPLVLPNRLQTVWLALDTGRNVQKVQVSTGAQLDNVSKEGVDVSRPQRLGFAGYQISSPTVMRIRTLLALDLSMLPRVVRTFRSCFY